MFTLRSHCIALLVLELNYVDPTSLELGDP